MRNFFSGPLNLLPAALLLSGSLFTLPAPASSAPALDSLLVYAEADGLPAVPEPVTPDTPAGAEAEDPGTEVSSSSTDDLVFYVWSDSHFGAYDYSNSLRLDIMRQMNGLKGRKYPSPFSGETIGAPSFLLNCGDITENGQKSQWDGPDIADHRSYVRTIKHLDPSIRTYEVLGNHDSRAAENIRAEFAAKQGGTYYSFDERGVHFVMLDPYTAYNTSAPDLDSAQLDWLKRDLGALKEGTPVLVAMHVHPDSGASALDRTSRLGYASSQALYDIVKGKNVLAFMHGHLHRRQASKWRGIDVIEPAGFAYPFPHDYSNEDPTFGVVRIQENRITVLAYNWLRDSFVYDKPLLDKTFRRPEAAEESAPGPVRLAYEPAAAIPAGWNF